MIYKALSDQTTTCLFSLISWPSPSNSALQNQSANSLQLLECSFASHVLLLLPGLLFQLFMSFFI